MNKSTITGGTVPPGIGRLAAAGIATVLIGGLAAQPALAYDHGHRDHRGYGYGYGHGWYGHRDWRGGAVYAPYPVFAPPPVYYAPQPSPGVSLFFPISIR